MVKEKRFSKTCACPNEIPGPLENKNQEPLNSTSGRGTRASYHDESPRDFGSRFAYTVSWTSDTNRSLTLCQPPTRHGVRKLSGPKPYETDPFHPSSLLIFFSKVNFSIYAKLFHLSSVWYLHRVQQPFMYVLFQN